MPKLPDRRHELYAQALAIGCSQQTAAKRAGFTAGSSNKAFLSRTANRRDVKERIAELRKKTNQKIQAVMTAPSEGTFAEMGLTTDWVTEQFQIIYEKALGSGSFAAANTAVQNLQGIVEKRREKEAAESAEGVSEKISVKDTLALLSGMRDLMQRREDCAGGGAPTETKVNLLRHRYDK